MNKVLQIYFFFVFKILFCAVNWILCGEQNTAQNRIHQSTRRTSEEVLHVYVSVCKLF